MKAMNFDKENFCFPFIGCFHCMEYYYINDHLFTPQKMIDVNGNVVWQADWDSFGTLTITINTVENNLRFPGQYYDSETGFYYNFHRYYMPEIGRYLREDEVKNKWDFNLYVYVGDRPVDSIDFTGLEEDNGENNGSSGYEKCVEICRSMYNRQMKRCEEKLKRCSVRGVATIIIYGVVIAYNASRGNISLLRSLWYKGVGMGILFSCYFEVRSCNQNAWDDYKKCVCKCRENFK